MNDKHTLVIFGNRIPKRDDHWFLGFNSLIASEEYKDLARKYKLTFTPIKSLIEPGSIKEAERITRNLSLLKTKNGERLSKSIQYKGYELWWVNYDNFMYRFALPFTQYSKFLNFIKDSASVYLFEPPYPLLFSYFLNNYSIRYKFETPFEKKITLAILIQVGLSFLSIFWAKLKSPKVFVRSNDMFSINGYFDFRMEFVYKELMERRVEFLEFIRSMEPVRVILQHAIKRRRPVIYSIAITNLVYYLANIFNSILGSKWEVPVSGAYDNEEKFWFKVATHYIQNTRGTIWAINVLKFIIKFIGLKTAIVPTLDSRTFHEVLALKLLRIKTRGILHGASSKYYNVYDFMPEYDGSKSLSLDLYGMWSEWWRDYYLENGKLYNQEQLVVSGPMRPMQIDDKPIYSIPPENSVLKILFVSEQLAVPSEVLPYLEILLKDKRFQVHITFRSYRDGFEAWLKENRPDILENIDETKIFRKGINEAIVSSDIVIGSHSTAVLEALLKLKPMVFFNTMKWGDYFDLGKSVETKNFFADSPEKLIAIIEKSRLINSDIILRLRERFFGNPYDNGSKWLVEETLKDLN